MRNKLPGSNFTRVVKLPQVHVSHSCMQEQMRCHREERPGQERLCQRQIVRKPHKGHKGRKRPRTKRKKEDQFQLILASVSKSRVHLYSSEFTQLYLIELQKTSATQSPKLFKFKQCPLQKTIFAKFQAFCFSQGLFRCSLGKTGKVEARATQSRQASTPTSLMFLRHR